MRTYRTISTRIAFPPSLVSAAALAASTDALDAYWRAERELAAGTSRPTALHADVLRTDRIARSLAQAASLR